MNESYENPILFQKRNRIKEGEIYIDTPLWSHIFFQTQLALTNYFNLVKIFKMTKLNNKMTKLKLQK